MMPRFDRINGAHNTERLVEVNTRLYKFVLGEEPRGIRSWRFSLGAKSGIFQIHEASYAQAESEAIGKAQKIGVDNVTVLP